MRDGRYKLLIVNRRSGGVEESVLCRKRSDDLVELLRSRDEMRETAVLEYRSDQVGYIVVDASYPERGCAEWCPECPRANPQGAFGDNVCVRCSGAVHA